MKKFDVTFSDNVVRIFSMTLNGILYKHSFELNIQFFKRKLNVNQSILYQFELFGDKQIVVLLDMCLKIIFCTLGS